MFTIRFWLLLLLFIGSYRQHHATEAFLPNTRESSVESDGEELPFLNEGEKLSHVAPDEQLKNGVEKRGSDIKRRPMTPERNFLLEFPTRGKEQNDPDVNDKLMEAMVIMETDQLANENSGNNDFSSATNRSIVMRSTGTPKTFPSDNTSLGIIEKKKSGNSAFQLHPSLQKGDNWATLDKEEDGAEDMELGDTAAEEATDQFESEGNNISSVGMNLESQTPMDQTDSSFAPNNEGMYNISKDAGIESFSNSESSNISANIRDPAMMARNQRHYPNILKNRKMFSEDNDSAEERNASFKRNGDELKQERRELTQNGENWNLRVKENTLTAKGNVPIPRDTDQSYYTQMKENNGLYGTDNKSQGYVPLGDTAQENDEAKDTPEENVEKKDDDDDDNNAQQVGFKDGMNPQHLVNTSSGGINNELQDTDEVEKVFEDDANASESDNMNVGYDDFLLGRRDFDADRDKRLIRERDRFLRVPDMKHGDDDDHRSGKSHDSNEITSEGTRRRNKGHKTKRPEGRSRTEDEDDNVQGEDEEECCQLMKKEKCKACSKPYKGKHGKGKSVSKSSNELDDCMDKDDEEVMDECSNTNHNHTHRPAPKERSVVLRSATVPDAQEYLDERRSLLNGGDTSSLRQILNDQHQGDLNLNEWQISNKNFLDKFTSNDSMKFDFLEDHSKTSDREGFQEDTLLPKNLTLRKIGGRKSNDYQRYHDEQENRNSALSWQFGPNVEIFNNGNTGDESTRNTLLQNAYGDKSHFYGNSIWENGMDDLNKKYPAGTYNILCKEEDTTTEKPVSSVIITGVTNKMNRNNVTSVQITSKKKEHKKHNPLHTILYCERRGKVEKKLSAFPVKKTYPPLPDYKFPPHNNSTNLLLGFKPNGAPRNSASISGLVEGQTRHGPFNSVTVSGVLGDEWDDGLEARNSTSLTIIAPYVGRITTYHPLKPVDITEIPFIRLMHNQSPTNGIVINDTSTTAIVEKRPFIDNAFSENGVPNFEREGKPHMEGKSDNTSKEVFKTKEGEREEESKLKEDKNMTTKEGFQGSKQLNQITNVEQAKFTPISEKGTFTNSEVHGGKVEDNVKLESQNRASNMWFNQQQFTSSNFSNMKQFGNSQLVAGQDGNSLSGVENTKLERNNTNTVFDSNLVGRNKVENLRFEGQALPDRKVMVNNSVFESQALNKNWIGNKNSNNMMYQTGSGNNESQGSQLNEHNSDSRNQTKSENLKTPHETNNVMSQLGPANSDEKKTDKPYDFRGQIKGNWIADKSANGMIQQISPTNTLTQDEKLGSSDIGSQTRSGNWKTDESANNMMHQVRPNSNAQDEKMANFDFRNQARNGNWKPNGSANGVSPQVRPPSTMSHDEKLLGNSDFKSQTRNENWKADQNSNDITHQTRPPNTMPQGERMSGNKDSGGQTRNENWKADENAKNIIHQMRPSNSISQGEKINANSDIGSQARNGNWKADEKSNSVMQQTRPSNTMSQGEQINRNSDLGSQTRNENWRANENTNNHTTPPNTMLQDIKMTDRNVEGSKTKNENWVPNEGVNNMMQQTKPFNISAQDGKHINGNFDLRSQNKTGNWMANKNVNDIMHQDGITSDKIPDFRSQVKNEKWMPSKPDKDMMHESSPSNNVSQYSKIMDGNAVFRSKPSNENWISNTNGADMMHQTRPVNMASQNDNMKDRYSEPANRDKNGKWMSNENANDMVQRTRPSNTEPQDGKMTDRNSEQVRNENRMSNKNTYSLVLQTKPSNTASQDNTMANRNSGFRIQYQNGKWMSKENANDIMLRIIPPNNQDSKMTHINSSPRSQIKNENWKPDQNTNDRIQPARLPNTISGDDKMTGGNSDFRSQTSNENRMTAENSQAMIHQNTFQEEKGTENYNFRSQTNENWMTNGNTNQLRPSNNSGVSDSHSFTRGKVESNSLTTNDINLSPSFGNTRLPADNQYNIKQDSTVNTSPITNFPPENRMEINTESKDEIRPNNEPPQDESMNPSAPGIKASFYTGFNIHKEGMKSSPVETSTQNSLETPEDMDRELRNRVSSISAGNYSNVQESDSGPSVGRLDMNIAFTGSFPSNQRQVTDSGYLHRNMGRLEVIPERGADKVVIFPLPVKNFRNENTGRKIFIDSPSNVAGRKYIHVSAPMTNPSFVGKNIKQSFSERKIFPNNPPIINNLIPMFKNTNMRYHKSDVLPLKSSANNDTKLRILVSNPQELVQILKEFKMKNARLQENNMMTPAKRGRGQNYAFSNRYTIKPGEDLLNLIQSFRRASEFRRLAPFKPTGEKENVLQYREILQNSQSIA